MLETFSFSFNAICPMVLLMLSGLLGRKLGYLTPGIVKKVNAFAFRVGIPVLMFCNVYSLKGLEEISLPLILFVVISLAGLTVVGAACAHFFAQTRSQKGVIIQMGFRSNYGIIGSAIALSLGGIAGNTVATSLQVPSIIYFNAVGVLFLTIYSDDADRNVDVWKLLKSICKNPLILGQVAGLLCLVIRQWIPLNAQEELVFSISGSLPWLYSFLESMAQMTSPLVLVLLGAQVDFSAVGELKKPLIAGCALRLGLAPLAGFAMAVLADRLGMFALTPAVISALVTLYGSPAPVASAVMAEEMNCYGELGRQYVVWSTTLSMVTIFLWVLVLRGMNWL